MSAYATYTLEKEQVEYIVRDYIAHQHSFDKKHAILEWVEGGGIHIAFVKPAIPDPQSNFARLVNGTDDDEPL